MWLAGWADGMISLWYELPNRAEAATRKAFQHVSRGGPAQGLQTQISKMPTTFPQ
jgi:hypothetical protein